MQTNLSHRFKRTLLVTALLSSLSGFVDAEVIIGKDINSSVGPNDVINEIYSANRGSNGGGDQSQQFGDILYGTTADDVIIGGLGIDTLWGKSGDDIIIGGTEDFNPLNRDRAFGGEGEDIFIWAPGDGNDFFDGGNGTDVLMIGLIGESKDDNGEESGAPFFAVSPPGSPGAGDFDGIHLNSNNLPLVDVINGPGFCEIVEKNEADNEALQALNIDHLIRFVLRGVRNSFLESQETDTPLADDGLRISVHLKDVEYLVCGGIDARSVKIFDLSVMPYLAVDESQLPLKVRALLIDILSA
jgi:hypothetical protein